VVSLAIFALISTLNHLNLIKYIARVYPTGNWFNLSVYRYGEKLDCLDGDLSPHHTVGFIADFNHTQNIEYYQLTQYFLAPTLIAFSTEQPYVIGFAPQPDNLESILSSHPDLQIIKDCENGIILFAGEP
jgi:hypothetical protein